MNCCRRMDNLIGGNEKKLQNKLIRLNPIRYVHGGKELEIDESLYKQILIKHDPNNKKIMQALYIVKKYVIREKLIIVGGMAIDFALRLKGSKLYGNDEIPDYDFITPHHWIDAYEITQWLTRIGLTDISTINAMHPTTMRVRVMLSAVADITYVPQFIFDKLPRLNYHGFDFIHPYFQYTDQHHSLCYGYENINFDRPVMQNRWVKDMKRYDMLWEKYPLKWDKKLPHNAIKFSNEIEISIDLISNQCIAGFLALLYWVTWSDKKGFKLKTKLGKCEISKTCLKYTLPINVNELSIYTNNIKEFYEVIILKYRPKKEQFYTKLLDKIPRKIILDNKWELLDNKNSWISAHKIGEYYVVNIQAIMMYMLLQYILLDSNEEIERKYLFYIGYMTCRDLLQFGVDNEIAELLPTSEFYGKDNNVDAYLLYKLKHDKKSKKIKADIPNQPQNIYEHHLRLRKVPKQFYKFNPEDTELFHIDGKECDKFI